MRRFSAQTSVSTDFAQSSDQVEKESAWDFEFEGLNELVSDSDAAVLARVDAVSEPRWNSKEGLQWENDFTNPETQALPMEYRDAVIVVERPLYSSTELAVEVGQRVELRLWGSGKATRGPVGDVEPPLAFNEIAGRIAAGDLRIFVLERSDFPMEGGPVPVVRISNQFQGTWKVVDEAAESADQRRSVASAALLTAALIDERAIGRNEQRDEKTRVHPLGDS